MDEAIKLRPRDWSYQVSRAALALAQGNPNAASDWHDSAQNIMLGDKNKSAGLRFYTQTITEYEAVVNDSNFAGLWSDTQAQTYGKLSQAYTVRYDMNKAERDQQMANFYMGKYEATLKKK